MECHLLLPFFTLYHPHPTYLKAGYFHHFTTHAPKSRFLPQYTLRDTVTTLYMSFFTTSILFSGGILFCFLQWNLLFSLKEYYDECHYIREINMKLF